MNEAADSVWSTRQMDRQISTLYYERLLASREKETVVAEAEEKLNDNPTLGIIICSQKSEGKQLFASRYKLYLPTEEEFKRMLESIE